MTALKILPAAAKYLKKLKDKHLKTLYKDAIDAIMINPMLGEEKAGDLKGIRCYDIYYHKVNYELAYKIVFEDEEIIVVLLAGTRENFYNELKRYIL